jgi:hypothetical protein
MGLAASRVPSSGSRKSSSPKQSKNNPKRGNLKHKTGKNLEKQSFIRKKLQRSSHAIPTPGVGQPCFFDHFNSKNNKINKSVIISAARKKRILTAG